MIYILQSYGIHNKERRYNSCYIIDKTGLIIAPSTSKLSSFARTEIEIDRIDDRGIAYHSIGKDLDEYVGELFVDDPKRKQFNNGYLNVYMCLFSVDEFFKSLQNEEDLCQWEVIFKLLSVIENPKKYIDVVIDYFKRYYHHYVYFDLYNSYKDGLYGLSGGIDGYYDLLLSDLSEEDKKSFISVHKGDELWEELVPSSSDYKKDERICVFRKDVLPRLVNVEFHDDDEVFSWMADRLDFNNEVQVNFNYVASAEIKDDTYFCSLIVVLFYLYDFLNDFEKENALECVGVYLASKNNDLYKLFYISEEDYYDTFQERMMQRKIYEYKWSNAVEYAKQQAEKGNSLAIKVLEK